MSDHYRHTSAYTKQQHQQRQQINNLLVYSFFQL